MATETPTSPASGAAEEITYFVFTAAGQRLALPLLNVERVVRAVEITPLPHPQPGFAGVVDVHGEVVPVIALHKWLEDPAVPKAAAPDDPATGEQPALKDHFILVRHEEQLLALWADTMEGVFAAANQDRVLAPDPLNREDATRWHLIKSDNGMVLEIDIAALLASTPSDWRQALPDTTTQD